MATDEPAAATTAAPAAPAATRPAAPAPSVHLRALITWLAVFPAITVAQLLLGPTLAPLPMPLRTLVVTALVVPAVVYALLPALLRVRAALHTRRR